MAIDFELRSKGVGASEVAAVLGLDQNRDAFSVYVEKTGTTPRPEPNARQRRGKYLEQGIVQWYSDSTGRPTQWSDTTVSHAERSWQVYTPDAFVLSPEKKNIGGVDAKTAGIGAHDEWGDSGTSFIPDRVAIQCQWSCSGSGLPWWDVACLCSLDDLRIYRVHFARDIEAILLEEVERFWKDNVLARVPPAPTYKATETLKRLFPRNIEKIRAATEEEDALLATLKAAKAQFKVAEREKECAENRVRLAIGESDGLLSPLGKVTWKKDADSLGTDWEAVARDLMLQVGLYHPIVLKHAPNVAEEIKWDELLNHHQIVTREGPRKLITPRAWGKETE